MQSKYIQLAIVVLVIIGIIYFLESSKVVPASDVTNQDIDVEAIITKDFEDTVESRRRPPPFLHHR